MSGFYLERFVDTSRLARDVAEEREEPDFWVRFEGPLVGVEVTQLLCVSRFQRIRAFSPARLAPCTEHAIRRAAAAAKPPLSRLFLRVPGLQPRQ